MMISVWTNPTVIFILIGARMMEQSQVKHELLVCARVLLGNIQISYLKNLRYWNACLLLPSLFNCFVSLGLFVKCLVARL